MALVVNLAATGEFDRVELAQLINLGLTAVLGTLAGYWARPNEVTH